MPEYDENVTQEDESAADVAEADAQQAAADETEGASEAAAVGAVNESEVVVEDAAEVDEGVRQYRVVLYPSGSAVMVDATTAARAESAARDFFRTVAESESVRVTLADGSAVDESPPEE